MSSDRAIVGSLFAELGRDLESQVAESGQVWRGTWAAVGVAFGLGE